MHDLDYIINNLDIRSPYGREALRNLAPFRRKDEALAQKCFDDIEVLVALGKDRLDEIGIGLAFFKNIRGTIAKIENMPLNQVELFEIKGFLLALERFASVQADVPVIIGTITPSLDILDPKGLRLAPFSLESPTLTAIRHEKNSSPENWAEVCLREDAEEKRVMEELSQALRAFIPDFLAVMNALGQMDLLRAKALAAIEYGGCRPKISMNTLVFKGMGNPYITAALAERGRRFTKISIALNQGVAVITGANMGGKSVALKTLVLNANLCRLGFFPIADEALAPLFDDICLIASDGQSTRCGLSSFGAEISRLNEIIPRLPNEYLLIALDEPARTTNPAEGAAIARGLAEYLAEAPAISVITTHYERIAAPGMARYQMAGLCKDIAGLNSADIADLASHMSFELLMTPPDAPVPKDAITICQIMGLDEALMRKITQARSTASLSL